MSQATSTLYAEIRDKIASSPLSEVLPLLLMLAQDIKDEELANWVLLEIRGYSRSDPLFTKDMILPEYRAVSGLWYDDSGRHLVIRDPKHFDSFNFYRVGMGVAELEGFTTGSVHSVFDNFFPPLIRQHLNFEATHFRFHSSQASNVLTQIRARAIEWLSQISTKLSLGPSDTIESDNPINHVVLLVHGIRTEADWQEMVVAQIETSNTKVLPIKYGYFDVFQFLLPGPTRRGPIQRVLKEIRLAQVQYPGAKLSVIAHSFGTYIVSQVIQKNFDIKLHRTLFCGSVIPATYPWESVFHQFAGDPVLNECGKGDIWPVIAQSVTWGYGATGTHGFGTVVVKDRYHPGGHSQYFDKEFVAKYWVPFIQNGEIRPSEWEKERPTTPLGLSLLGRLPLRYILLSLAILATAFVAWRIVVNFLYPNTTNAEPGLLI